MKKVIWNILKLSKKESFYNMKKMILSFIFVFCFCINLNAKTEDGINLIIDQINTEITSSSQLDLNILKSFVALDQLVFEELNYFSQLSLINKKFWYFKILDVLSKAVSLGVNINSSNVIETNIEPNLQKELDIFRTDYLLKNTEGIYPPFGIKTPSEKLDNAKSFDSPLSEEQLALEKFYKFVLKLDAVFLDDILGSPQGHLINMGTFLTYLNTMHGLEKVFTDDFKGEDFRLFKVLSLNTFFSRVKSDSLSLDLPNNRISLQKSTEFYKFFINWYGSLNVLVTESPLTLNRINQNFSLTLVNYSLKKENLFELLEIAFTSNLANSSRDKIFDLAFGPSFIGNWLRQSAEYINNNGSENLFSREQLSWVSYYLMILDFKFVKYKDDRSLQIIKGMYFVMSTYIDDELQSTSVPPLDQNINNSFFRDMTRFLYSILVINIEPEGLGYYEHGNFSNNLEVVAESIKFFDKFSNILFNPVEPLWNSTFELDTLSIQRYLFSYHYLLEVFNYNEKSLNRTTAGKQKSEIVKMISDFQNSLPIQMGVALLTSILEARNNEAKAKGAFFENMGLLIENSGLDVSGLRFTTPRGEVIDYSNVDKKNPIHVDYISPYGIQFPIFFIDEARPLYWEPSLVEPSTRNSREFKRNLDPSSGMRLIEMQLAKFKYPDKFYHLKPNSPRLDQLAAAHFGYYYNKKRPEGTSVISGSCSDSIPGDK